VRSLRQTLAMLRDQASVTPPGQWVQVIGGWSKDQFTERRLPTISELNAAAEFEGLAAPVPPWSPKPPSTPWNSTGGMRRETDWAPGCPARPGRRKGN
jgi:hypothetical protein